MKAETQMINEGSSQYLLSLA